MSSKKKAERRGRPPKADAGNYENVYTSLEPDVMIYVRRKMASENRTRSAAIAQLVKGGIAAEIVERERLARR